MNKIILLMKDKTIQKINEKKLKKMNLEQIQYLLVPIHTNEKLIRNYIMLEPAPELLFDNAIIEYQLALVAFDDDAFHQYLNPIRIETTSLIELLDLINCIYRISCINHVSVEDMYDGSIIINIAYFGVHLIKGDKRIDNYFMDMNSGEDYPYYYAGKIVKQFSKFISDNIVNDLAHEAKYLTLSDDGFWEITKWPECEVVGIPMILSNTILFCTEKDLERFLEYNVAYYDYCVLDVPNDINGEFCECIKNNQSRLDYYESYVGYYTNTHKTVYLVKSAKFSFLDIIINIKFILEISDLVFRELYVDDSNVGSSFTPHALLSIELRSTDEKISYQRYFYSEAIEPLSEILEEVVKKANRKK